MFQTSAVVTALLGSRDFYDKYVLYNASFLQKHLYLVKFFFFLKRYLCRCSGFLFVCLSLGFWFWFGFWFGGVLFLILGNLVFIFEARSKVAQAGPRTH